MFSTMQCDICFRTGGYKLPFLCPTDARNRLYEPRVEHAKVLLDKAALDDEVTALLAKRSTSTTALDQSTGNDEKTGVQWDLEQASAERDAAFDRTKQIMAHADELRAKVEEAKADIARRKAKLATRRSDLSSLQNGLEARRRRLLEDVEKKTKMTRYRWDQMHVMTAQSRAFLCGEAARLYGLRKYIDSETGSEEYSIAGVKIIDLRAMNSASAVQITTSLSHIAHLLVLASHYLALRLPAEITLPHRDYPLPTVFSLTSSYMHSNIPFPGHTPTQSFANSPSASKHEAANLPRPRPLFVNKPLPLLAKEDHTTYSRFIEGATLLAYDVAWVCKSQGIPVGPGLSSLQASPTTFEDICSMGKNLFNLLIGTKGARPSPSASTPTKTKPNSKPGTDDTESPSQATTEQQDDYNDTIKTPSTPTPSSPFADITIGDFSHGTAHTNLNSPLGTEFVRTFKLLSPMKLADQLKTQLLSEVTSAEWEVVDVDREGLLALEGDTAGSGSISAGGAGATATAATGAAPGNGLDDDDGVVVGAKRWSGEMGVGGGIVTSPGGGHVGKVLRGVLSRSPPQGYGYGGVAQSFMSMRTVLDAVELVGGGGGGGRVAAPPPAEVGVRGGAAAGGRAGGDGGRVEALQGRDRERDRDRDRERGGDQDNDRDRDKERKSSSGTSGWMKVKSR